MKSIHTITATEMRGINRTAILEMIRREGPLARSAIAGKLQVSLPTVMRITDELEQEGLVRSTGQTEWSGGRRRTLVELNASAHLTIGVDLGGTHFYGGVVDLGGTVIEEQLNDRCSNDCEDNYQALASIIDRLLQDARAAGRHILGIGVGVPGVTLHETGVVQWAPSLGWRDFPLRQRLHRQFNLPVIVDNDVNLAAQGEMWFGLGQNVDNLVLLTVGAGIGAGVVIDGAIYRGAHEAAGEIGYLLPGREFLNRYYPEFGALEEQSAGTGIAARARRALAGSLAPEKLAALNASDVFEARRRGEAWAVTIIDETVDYLALAVAAICACYDPDVIVLGGGVARSADLLIEPILARINRAVPCLPPLAASSLGHRAGVLGAMINLLHNTSDFFYVRKLS